MYVKREGRLLLAEGGVSQNFLCKWGRGGQSEESWEMERKVLKSVGEHRKVDKTELFQGTKTGNLVGARVLAGNSNTTFYLKIKAAFDSGKEKF